MNPPPPAPGFRGKNSTVNDIGSLDQNKTLLLLSYDLFNLCKTESLLEDMFGMISQKLHQILHHIFIFSGVVSLMAAKFQLPSLQLPEIWHCIEHCHLEPSAWVLGTQL